MSATPRCAPCADGSHDGCNNTAEDPTDGGLTSCFCDCMDDWHANVDPWPDVKDRAP